jgi:hypothetical protein
MKKVMLMALICLCSVFGYSQNGGQANENNVLKVEYVGYSNNNHIFKVINKIDCQLGVKIDKNGITSSQIMTNLQETIILIPGPQTPQITIKAKRESGANCKQNPDNGWVELQSNIALPIKFGGIVATKVSPNLIKLTFDVEEDHTLKSYGIMVSPDGKNFKRVTVLFPNGIVPYGSTSHKKYSVLVKF